MRRFAVTGTVWMSLILGACGGTEPAEVEETELGTVEGALIPACYRPGMTTSFQVIWYLDAAKTRESGRDICDCGNVTMLGTHGANYYKVIKFDGCYSDQM